MEQSRFRWAGSGRLTIRPGSKTERGISLGSGARPPVAYGRPAWSAEAAEIARLDAALRQQSTARRTSASAGQDPLEPLLAGLGEGDPGTLRTVFTALRNVPDVVDALADLEEAGELSSLIEQRRQRDGLKRLERQLGDPDVKAEDLYDLLYEEWWVFGGRYVVPELRARFHALDLPVRRYDNVLHIVKLCEANVPDLVLVNDRQVRVGAEVQDAVAIAADTLRELDRTGSEVSRRLTIDCHRAFTTIVIGHPRHLGREVNDALKDAASGRGMKAAELIAETFRTYNSHLSRIEIITYEDLLVNAEQTLSP